MLAQALIASALAAPGCELDPPTLRAAVVDARSAVLRDDLDVAQHEIDRVIDDLDCIDFVPERRLWAELLVVMAVVAFAEGGDWESPLASALRIRPAIDRIVGVVHPIYNWVPPDEAPLQPVVSRNQIHIDGRAVQAIPPPRGWYLVQKTDGTAWNTVFKRDEPVDTTWLLAPVERAPRIGVEVSLGVGGGGGAAGQWRVTQGTSTTRSVYDLEWRDDQNQQIGLRASTVQGRFGRPYRGLPVVWGDAGIRATFFSRVGVEAQGNVMFGIRPYARYLRGGVIYAGRRWELDLGAAVYDLFLARYRDPFAHDAEGLYDPTFDGDGDGAADEVENPLVPGGATFYFGQVGVAWSPVEAVRIGVRFGMRDLYAQMGELHVRARTRALPQLPEVLLARPFFAFVLRGGYGTFVGTGERSIRSTRIETGISVGATFGAVP